MAQVDYSAISASTTAAEAARLESTAMCPVRFPHALDNRQSMDLYVAHRHASREPRGFAPVCRIAWGGRTRLTPP